MDRRQKSQSPSTQRSVELIDALLTAQPDQSLDETPLLRRRSMKKPNLRAILPKQWKPFSSPPRSPLKQATSVCPSNYSPLKKSRGLRTGDILDLDAFPEPAELSDGVKITLKEMVDTSVGGVVIFTFPQAETPECKWSSLSVGGTKAQALTLSKGIRQANLFKASYHLLRGNGYALYGMSNDAPDTNTFFRLKYNLPYILICDQERKLIEALGFKDNPPATLRGVIAIDKEGKVLAENVGSPEDTVGAITPLLDSDSDTAGYHWH